MRIDILTIFPELFDSWLKASIIRNAREKDKLHINLVDLKKFSGRKDGRIDDRPFGGGPGMLFKPEVVINALESIDQWQNAKKIHLSPSGQPWTQTLAQQSSEATHLIFLCSRYEGVDQRALDMGSFEDISLGDYVSMGGEAPAMVMIESITRLIPGVLGHEFSAFEDSFSPGRKGLLDCPHYTRPENFRENHVPEVLLTGNHQKIKEWRETMAYQRSVDRRKDLLK